MVTYKYWGEGNRGGEGTNMAIILANNLSGQELGAARR